MSSDPGEAREIVPREPTLPELDPEQRRAFEEFQHFQAYQRYIATQGQLPNPSPLSGDGLPAGDTQTAPGVPSPDMQAQLNEIQTRLSEVAASQQRTERAVNPPLWKKVLRSRLVGLLVVMLLLAGGGIWAVHHFFGSSQRSLAALPRPVNEPGAAALGGQTPDATVIGVYHNVASGNAAGVCVVFTDLGRRQFAADNGAPTCVDAVHKLAGEITDVNAYTNSLVASGDLAVDDGESYKQNSFVVTSCAATISGGPRLGEFTLVRAPNKSWIVFGHRNETCPTPSITPTSG